MSIIQLVFSGNLTDNATTKELEGGKSVTNFTLAVNDGYTDKEGKYVSSVSYLECSIWNNNKIAKHLVKGKHVTITSDSVPTVNAFNDKEGKAKGTLRINVNTIDFIPEKSA